MIVFSSIMTFTNTNFDCIWLALYFTMIDNLDSIKIEELESSISAGGGAGAKNNDDEYG